MHITTILPVSRAKYLDRVLDSIKNQTYKPQSLIVIVDGPDDVFLEARSKVVGLEFDHVLCVHSNNTRPAISIPERRRHIVDLHNQFRELIGRADWIFSIEDDGILPSNALHRLVRVVQSHEDAGLVTGVELGRWGVPYVGAWRADDIFDTRNITSLENKTLETPFTIDEIDACGLYCALIDADLYKSHEFFTSNGLGPDVNLGLYIRQQGLTNYIDWGIPVTHLTNRHREEIEIPATNPSKVVKLQLLSGSTWKSYN